MNKKRRNPVRADGFVNRNIILWYYDDDIENLQDQINAVAFGLLRPLMTCR